MSIRNQAVLLSICVLILETFTSAVSNQWRGEKNILPNSHDTGNGES